MKNPWIYNVPVSIAFAALTWPLRPLRRVIDIILSFEQELTAQAFCGMSHDERMATLKVLKSVDRNGKVPRGYEEFARKLEADGYIARGPRR